MVRYFLILCLGFPLTFLAQKKEPFVGKLVYSIEIVDTSLTKLIPPNEMVIYTNDTLIRIENYTEQFGVQAIVKHLQLEKSYLLINTQYESYAIQTDHSKDSIRYPYTFEKKWFKRKINGFKGNRLSVMHENFEEPLEYIYFKKYDVKYINTLENFPGLPIQYFISSVDGTYRYTLKSMDSMESNRDWFGIPSNAKKVSFNQFMDDMIKFQGMHEE